MTRILTFWLLVGSLAGCAESENLEVIRFKENPIIRPEMLAGEDGENINGPSLIRAPGWLENPQTLEDQPAFVASSSDGIHFIPRSEALGLGYFRVFEWEGFHYALGMPGVFYRSRSGVDSFEEGPTLFSEDMRHSALKLDGDVLSVFHTVVGEVPERIVLSKIPLTSDWLSWKESEPVVILEPERVYDGADLPLEPSARDLAPGRVRQLRDPAIFQEDGKTYLLYSVAGEWHRYRRDCGLTWEP